MFNNRSWRWQKIIQDKSMSLMCQQNSYLKEFHTRVKSCTPASGTVLLENGKKDKVQGYEVILDDTILFPEGGGQV
ncbi:unnamed protein product [Lymnaea stagnalis]|uniref:Alanyl-tRNA synthetase class IIc N-terminal domain-containing protein n=1 Tax=Lymnaea stagnalis TaxID=6523 RepID=A0AAV2HM16_LYMST